MQQLVRARHETINGRFKQFSILKQVFRHDKTFHSPVFRAIVNVTQLTMDNESPVFGIYYDDSNL